MNKRAMRLQQKKQEEANAMARRMAAEMEKEQQLLAQPAPELLARLASSKGVSFKSNGHVGEG